MNNGLKALLIAASTIITCMIVTLGFSLAKEAKQIGNQVTEELEHYKTTLSERDLMKYDGTAVYGTDILNLVKTGLSGKNAGILITVTRGGLQKSGRTAADFEEGGFSGILVAGERYRGRVIRNKNDVIIEIQFDIMKEEEE